MPPYAHSLPDSDPKDWEPLADHLQAVGACAASLAAHFGWAALAQVAGSLHDIGKVSTEFQAYIRKERPKGGDHSSAGAIEALRAYPAPSQVGRILSFIIAGHHAGLANAADLEARLQPDNRSVPAYPGWKDQSGPLPPQVALSPTRAWAPGRMDPGFSWSFLIRMLFSCLVDADSLETERFYAEANREPIDRGNFTALAILRDRLEGHLRAKAANVAATDLNVLRAEVLSHATAAAEKSPGLFTLTVPTGGGKTLTSLSFALEHAVRHGLRRIIYVIPFRGGVDRNDFTTMGVIVGECRPFAGAWIETWHKALRR